MDKDTNYRFWKKVKKTDSCWLWRGCKDIGGYGMFWYIDRNIRAHRFSYTQIVGQIPKNKQLDHLCRNPSCVNPNHLEAVTCKVNVLRGLGFAGVNYRKTICKKGHPFNKENTRFINNRRQCKECQRENVRRYRYKLRLIRVGG